MSALADLHSALHAGAWPEALERALVAWRAARDPALADLIDRITARCELPRPPGDDPVEHQTWWIERARAEPDAVTIGGLLAVLGDRVDTLDGSINAVRARWASAPPSVLARHLAAGTAWPNNFQERAAALLGWPDDPRVARALVDIVRRPACPRAHGVALYELLADRVAELDDHRLVDDLSLLATEPRGTSEDARRLQTLFAVRARAKLATSRPVDAGPELAACLAVLPPPPLPSPPPARFDALWREVALHPEEIGVRAVLGDALVEQGDPRGDVIVLQCNARVPDRPLRGTPRNGHDGRVKTLIRQHWHAWLGDLALILPRRGCEVRGGMLEAVTVGIATSPGWAFAKAAGHRELACVQIARPGWVRPEHYVTFLLGLPRLPKTLGATGLDVISALRDRGTDLSRIHTLELSRSPIIAPNGLGVSDWMASPLRDAVAALAVAVPDLRGLVVRDASIARQLHSFGREVRLLFPAIRKVALDEPTAAALGDLAEDPLFDRSLRI